ncbi:hypothetical protein HY640_02765 [Candidatus Woesearchaeota archaeon]|nr:hypothetical protein [Candidatus Woesearchaeota archaeon]
MGGKDATIQGLGLFIPDTSYLIDLSQRNIWTLHAHDAYARAGNPEIRVPDRVINEYLGKVGMHDEYGVPLTSNEVKSALEEILGSWDTNITSFAQEDMDRIHGMWTLRCRKSRIPGHRYSKTDMDIMSTAVTKAKEGFTVYVASSDRDITETLMGHQDNGFPIVVFMPSTPRKDVLDKVCMLVTGQALMQVPEVVGRGYESYNYFLKVVKGVPFGEGCTANVAVAAERFDSFRKPPKQEGISWVKIIVGTLGDDARNANRFWHRTREFGLNELVGFTCCAYPGDFSLYKIGLETNGAQPTAYATSRISVDAEEVVWARVDLPFMRAHSPRALGMLSPYMNR